MILPNVQVQYVTHHVINVTEKRKIDVWIIRRMAINQIQFLPKTMHLQHKVFTPFRIECLSAHASRLNETCGNGWNAVPVFSTSVTATSRNTTSLFSFETQPETKTWI